MTTFVLGGAGFIGSNFVKNWLAQSDELGVNLDKLSSLFDELRTKADYSRYQTQITHVPDHRNHDWRYAIDARKIERELGWKPAETFESGIRKTVQWYLHHPERVQTGTYRDWVNKQRGAA